MLVASESKREEEKVKGVSAEDVTGNPDIVPFEDNEEEEEEESEEEDESFGPAAQMRGRGRGIMWPPHMPLLHGGRPMLGVRGFPPGMIGPDGFGYGGVTPDGFSTPDHLFGPRMFAPFGAPRFPGDLSGLVFPGRPPQPGAMFPGMMMGGNPAGPFMGGMPMPGGNVARPNRPPLCMQPTFRMPPPPMPPNNRAPPKRDQRRTGSDRGPENQSSSSNSRGVDNAGQTDDSRYQHGSSGFRNNFNNDDSESEDEAPRRSRKRGSNEETAAS